MSHTDVPSVMVIGNCQADVYRDLLRSAEGTAVTDVRPVYEMTARDIPTLHADLARTDVLIVQPIRDDYRDLPLGHRQMTAQLPASATVVLVPVLRFAGLHPYQVLIRPPRDRSLVPPIAPYHDLRAIMAAATGDREVLDAVPDPDQAHASVRESVEALRTREQAHGTLTASDLLAPMPRWHTINHPDRGTLAEVFDRILAELPPGLIDPPPRIGDREPLGDTRAPVDPAVERALGLPEIGPREWLVNGDTVSAREVVEAHLAWYESTPGVVEEGLRRHAARIELLGLR